HLLAESHGAQQIHASKMVPEKLYISIVSNLIGYNEDVLHAEPFCEFFHCCSGLDAPLTGLYNNNESIDRFCRAPGEMLYPRLHVNNNDLITLDNEMLEKPS